MTVWSPALGGSGAGFEVETETGFTSSVEFNVEVGTAVGFGVLFEFKEVSVGLVVEYEIGIVSLVTFVSGFLFRLHLSVQSEL